MKQTLVATAAGQEGLADENEMRCVVSAANKQNSQPLNWLYPHINQD
jgi:hypothetical protein